MRAWVITPFEPIPTDGDVRLMRAGMLCATLHERGHEVTWWTPDFEHYTKVHRHGCDSTVEIEDGYEVRLLKSLGYRSHVSIRRLVHNYLLARRFQKAARKEDLLPDVIVCAWPTPDFCKAAVDYGEKRNIPVLVDVRDLWPDLWLEVFPVGIRSLMKRILKPYYNMARRAMSNACAITGITDEYVDWGIAHSGRERMPHDLAFELGFRPSMIGNAEKEVARNRLKEIRYECDGRFHIVFAGTFGRSFEFETVIEAARKLDRAAPARARITLCGSGDRWQQVYDSAEGIDSLQVLPRLGLNELQIVYEDADIGLAPYRNIDNFQKNIPNKVDEYLQMNLPLLSGVDGRIAELMDEEDLGRRYTAGDPDSLASMVLGLTDNPEEVDRLRQNARKYVEACIKHGGTTSFANHLENMVRERRGRNQQLPGDRMESKTS